VARTDPNEPRGHPGSLTSTARSPTDDEKAQLPGLPLFSDECTRSVAVHNLVDNCQRMALALHRLLTHGTARKTDQNGSGGRSMTRERPGDRRHAVAHVTWSGPCASRPLENRRLTIVDRGMNGYQEVGYAVGHAAGAFPASRRAVGFPGGPLIMPHQAAVSARDSPDLASRSNLGRHNPVLGIMELMPISA
jgi:hypothetical protein